MYTCTVALVHSRVLGKASRPSERYCSLLPPGARARIRGKSRQNLSRLPAVRVPTSDVNKCLVAQSPRSTSQAPSQGNTGPKLFHPWLAIDAGGYVMAESQPTAHSNTHSFTAPTISLIEAICCNVTPRRPPGRLATSLTQPDNPILSDRPRVSILQRADGADGQTESSLHRPVGPILACWSPGPEIQCSLT